MHPSPFTSTLMVHHRRFDESAQTHRSPTVQRSCEGQPCSEHLPASFAIDVPHTTLLTHNVTIVSGGTRFRELSTGVVANHQAFARCVGVRGVGPVGPPGGRRACASGPTVTLAIVAAPPSLNRRRFGYSYSWIRGHTAGQFQVCVQPPAAPPPRAVGETACFPSSQGRRPGPGVHALR